MKEMLIKTAENIELTEIEKNFVFDIFEILSQKYKLDNIVIEERTPAYKSICYICDFSFDFIRFKITNNTKWFTIFMTNSKKKGEIDESLFPDQKNKNQIHWKVKIGKDFDLSVYEKYILSALEEYYK